MWAKMVISALQWQEHQKAKRGKPKCPQIGTIIVAITGEC